MTTRSPVPASVPRPPLVPRCYRMRLEAPPVRIERGHLDLGGSNPRGQRIEVNSHFIEWDGRPFIPVVGEFHYARYPAVWWEESLRKMKAGGINVIGTYVFWNLHERRRGEFDWSGDLDLRRFIALCAANGLWAIVRLGPFCHGEIRNGGLPDWLYGRAFEVRSNDPEYLAEVRRWYGAVAGELEAQLFKDGGPVIGVQLENEYQHSAAPWEFGYHGSIKELTVAERDRAVTHAQVSASEIENRHAADGRAHLAALKALARGHGIDVPLYTATGWGNAAIVELGSVPVTAGYPFPFWAPPKPSPLYLYTDLRRRPDYSPVSYDPARYPSLSAEMGAGMMPTFGRRPVVPPESVAPMIVRTLGSGANGIGYYMYHGGSTPVFDGYYHEASGGLPRINYDFQAPIGEFGQVRAHHGTLKLLHLFLHAYGADLAARPTQLPPGSATLMPEDTETLRFAVRAADGAGYLFLHNYQDHAATRDLAGLEIRLEHGADEVAFPSAGTLALPRAGWAVLPFNLALDGVTLRSATVQPLTVLRRPRRTHRIFFSIDGLPPELVFGPEGDVTDGENCRADQRDGRTIVTGPAGATFAFSLAGQRWVVIPRELALTVLRTDDERLFFAEAELIPGPSELQVVARDRTSVELLLYPSDGDEPAGAGDGWERRAAIGRGWAGRGLAFEPVRPEVTVERVGRRKAVVRARRGLGGLHDLRLRITYRGDRGLAFIDGELVADHFYQGQPWEIGLRKFAERLATADLVLVFHPAHRTYGYFDDLPSEGRIPLADDAEESLSIEAFEFLADYSGVVPWPHAPGDLRARVD